MDLGVRQIRTAGKGSGSVEITLPGTLRHLVGLPCRILLQDGPQPDIVLQPELSAARAAFIAVWQAVALALLGEPAPAFPAGQFRFGVLPQEADPAVPYLCWQDGLALAANAAGPDQAGRIIAACASAVAADLGIGLTLAGPFGAVCGFLACGRVVQPSWQEPCDIASAELSRHPAWHARTPRADASPAAPVADPRAPSFWAHVTPGLAAAAELFARLGQQPAAYPALQAAWRRGRAVELNRD